MNFDLDDPLADILSGGSDDSFFDDDVLGKKRTPQKSTPVTDKKKSALFDLDYNTKPAANLNIGADKKKSSIFNLDDDLMPPANKSDETIQKSLESITKPGPLNRTLSKEKINISKEPPKTPLRSRDTSMEFGQTRSNEKITTLDRLDSLDKINVPKTDLLGKQTDKRKSSISLLDDILGGPITSKSLTKQIKPPSTSKSQDFDFDGLLGNKTATDSKKSDRISTAPSKTSTQTESKTESSVKSAAPRAVKSSDDWLGIFKDKDDGIKEVKEDVGMPDWLLGKESKARKSNIKREDSIVVSEQAKTNIVKDTFVDDDNEQKLKESSKESKSLHYHTQKIEAVTIPTTLQILTANNEDITQEGAALYMQQQESQLMVALQLKAQEEKLADMQLRQEESKKIQQQAKEAHHSQLNAMLEKQAVHRQQMQAIIMSHQEKINERIQALLGINNIDTNTEGYNDHIDDNKPLNPTHKESPHVKEKKQLLQLVQTLQENHDKEIDLMETSYRRQLAITDASLNQSEERLKYELDKLIKHYTEKIAWMEEEQLSYRHILQENVKNMTEGHAQDLREVRERHSESVKALQEQHAALMESFKSAVKQEHTLIKDSTVFSSDLTQLVSEVKESKTHCQQLLEVIHSLQDRLGQESGNSMKAREAHIDDMLQQLTRDRENFEKEKNESWELVKLLESRLKQMSQSIEEETSLLKQKRMEFEFEKATFNKQTEYAKNILKKQEEDIKMIKDEIQKEHQDKIAKIEEEKNKAQKDSAVVTKERMTVQNLRQELEKLKGDLQSQLDEVSEDRSRMNLEKQQLHMEEQRIVAKSRDLDLLAKSALEKQSQADRKYSEAEYIQRKYEDRVRRLQEHIISLNSREKLIAREKVALSRERLGLHNEKRQLESRQQCSLCRSLNQQAPPFNFGSTFQPELSNVQYLSMGVSRDYSVANADVLEREMSNLLGRDGGELRDRGDVGINLNQEKVLEPPGVHSEFVDPKLLLLRLDVQQVISNLNDEPEEKPAGEEQ